MTPVRVPRTIAQGMAVILASLALQAAEPVTELPMPSAADILARLQQPHPRLLISADELAALRQRTVTNTVLEGWRKELTERGRRMLDQAPSTYEIPDGLRLLSTSRGATRLVVYTPGQDRTDDGGKARPDGARADAGFDVTSSVRR